MNISYAEARLRAPKARDTWVRVALLNWWVTPLVYFVARYTGITPKLLTMGTWVVGCMSAFFFVQSYLIGAILYFVHFVMDGMDGKLSRIKGEDDIFRGMMDFLLDGTVCVLVVMALATAYANIYTVFLLLVWMCVHFLDMRFSAMVYNLRALRGLKGMRLIADDAGQLYRSRLIGIYARMQSRLEKWGLNALPTTGESAFFMFVLAPVIYAVTGNIGLVNLLTTIGILCVIPTATGNALLAVKLADMGAS